MDVTNPHCKYFLTVSTIDSIEIHAVLIVMLRIFQLCYKIMQRHYICIKTTEFSIIF